MAARGGWRPLSGLICEIVNSVGQGNFLHLSGKSQGISNTYGCGNHVIGPFIKCLYYLIYTWFTTAAGMHIKSLC